MYGLKNIYNVFTCLLDLFYPRLCVVCGKCLMSGEHFFCSDCLVDFPLSDENFTSGDEILTHFNELFRPEQLYSLFYYNKYDNYKNLVYKVKYHSGKELGVYLGRMLGEKMKETCKADCIIPVPLHKKRERQRGYNQSQQIALGMAEVLQIELLSGVICREKNNVSQTGKNREERQQNVACVFVLKTPEIIRGRHVLLVDDVITTGATIGACLRVLAEAGEVKFSLACLAQVKS